MKIIPVFACALALAVTAAAPPAGAFTMEPVNGGSGGGSSRIADPDAGYGRLADPKAGTERGAADTKSSPFSLSITGPEQRPSRSVDRPGIDNEHLYWNNGNHSR